MYELRDFLEEIQTTIQLGLPLGSLRRARQNMKIALMEMPREDLHEVAEVLEIPRGRLPKKVEAVMWSGHKPIHCELCFTPIKWRDFIDGKMLDGGKWAIMCIECFPREGVGFGTGRGQRYHWNPATKKYWKVEG